MNPENPLVKNSFVNQLTTDDLSNTKVRKYANYYEMKDANLKKQEIISKANQGNYGNGNDNDNSKFILPYGRSNKFKGTFRESPETYMNTSVSENYITSEHQEVICIDTIHRDTDAYPNSNEFTWHFEQEYTNVTKIELISTELPNSDQTIKNYPTALANNTMSWINYEDSDLNIFTSLVINTIFSDTIDITLTNTLTAGTYVNILVFNSKLDTDTSITGIIDSKYKALVIDSTTLRISYTNGLASQGTCSVDLGFPVYTVEFVPGNYNATTLAAQMQVSLNLVKRRNGTGQFHYFDVSVNIDTNVISFESVITKQLGSAPISTTANSTIITVTSLNHGYKTGDLVFMIGILNISGIPGDILNGNQTITVIDFNTFTFEVNISASSTDIGGGSNVLTGTQAPYRILFQTANTLIQYNTGFNNEDSSEYIGAENPITTKTLQINNAVITTIPGNPAIIGSTIPVIRLTTTIDHGLYVSNVIFINNITNTFPVQITTDTPHLLQLPTIINVTGSNCLPSIDGDMLATPTGPYSFTVNSRTVTTAGTLGNIIHSGDRIKVSSLRTTPTLNTVSDFYVVNSTSVNSFDIIFRCSNIDSNSISNTQIYTSQVFVNHPNHSFNTIGTITAIDSVFSSIFTPISNSLVGTYNTAVSVIDGPVSTNTVDILLTDHGLSTSDTVRIKDSNTDPLVDGTFKIQVVSVDEFRINFVHASLVTGTCTVITGDTTTITNSNSLPKTEGTFNIRNRIQISNISTGVSSVSITTGSPNYWVAGDSVVISGTDSTPNIDGTYTIQSITSTSIFVINTVFPVITIGTVGRAINTNRFQIETNFLITVPGTFGSLTRDQNVILYRIAADSINGNSIGGIRLSSINGISFPIIDIIDTNNYMIRVVQSYATSTISSGGSDVYTSSMVSGWRSIQANTTSGNSDDGTLLARAINLAGEPYLFLLSNTLNGQSTIKSSSRVKDILGKINLKDSPGLECYDGFITSPTYFDPPVTKLPSMNFQMVNRDGFLFNFKNVDYSFSLRISETHTKLIKAHENTRTK